MFENRADIQPFLAETELGLFAAEIETDQLREATVADESDDFWGDVMDRGLMTLTSGRIVLAHRLGGWPIPEQPPRPMAS